MGRLRETEWPPFRAAIAAGVGAIMTAHVVVEALDEVPATLSARALGHLPRELQFNAAIVSDDISCGRPLQPHGDGRAGPARWGRRVFGLQAPEVTLELYRGLVVGTEEERLSHQVLADAK